MVNIPGEYLWSSYCDNGMGIKIKLIDEHEAYIDLGKTKSARLLNYRSLFENKIARSVVDEIRVCANKAWVIGSEKFKREAEETLNRKINNLGWGGDRKSEAFSTSRTLTP